MAGIGFMGGGGAGGPNTNSISFPYVEYQRDLNNEEILRMDLGEEEIMILQSMELNIKGGGTNANSSMEFYDDTAGASIASVNAGQKDSGDPLGQSSPGATVILRVTTPADSSIALSLVSQSNIED